MASPQSQVSGGEIDTQIDILRRLVAKNWRGTSTTDLKFMELDIEEKLQDEIMGNLRLYLLGSLEDLNNELERREGINTKYIKAPDRDIVKAVKEAIRLEDVIEWYTEVFYAKDRWKFRCTLHGEDKEPSGVIYPTQKWWCFGCNQGGDVFDAVQAFERVDLPQAIRKLATYVGVELKEKDGTRHSREDITDRFYR